MREISFITTADKRYCEVCDLRKRVFNVEQQNDVFSLTDSYENDATFGVLYEENVLCSAVRIFKIDENHDIHIDNIVTEITGRGKGYGKELIEATLDFARKNGAKTVSVNSQVHAIPFYEKCGFAVCGSSKTVNGKVCVPMTTNEFGVFDNSKWIGSADDLTSFVVGKKFTLTDKNATLRIAAMGFIEVYLNGKKLPFMTNNSQVGINFGDHFIPALSNYEKRDLTVASYPISDTMTQRIYYLEFDLSDYAVKGENFLAVHVGAGWYGWKNRYNSEGMPIWGEAKVMFEIIDGENIISSDENDVYKPSFVTETDIYINENFDGRLFDKDFFNEKNFVDAKNVKVYKRPASILCRQTFPGDSVDGRIYPKVVSKKGDIILYDLGEDVAGKGVFKFRDDARKGDECVVVIGEEIDENGELDLQFTGGFHKNQRDTYVCSDDTDMLFTPIFTWRAGRFITVRGNAELLYFDRVYSPVKQTAEFKSNDETLNWLFNTYVKTQNSNIHDFVPSDCPHRERLGYTGDGQLCSDAAMTIFDSKQMYTKWLQDIADCQNVLNGHVQHTAPFLGGGGGPGGWGGAMCIVPWNFYKHFGDISVLEKYYPNMKSYISYMVSHSVNGIVVREEKDGWCLGDWCVPGEMKISESFVNTYFLIKCIDILIQSANLLKYDDDTKYYVELKKSVENSFCSEFFSDETGSFIGGVNGADAFGVDLGLGDERTLKNIVEKYTSLGQYDTGIFGTPILTDVLFKNGYQSLALEILTSKKENSYYNMKSHGATTLWEYWDGKHSHSHPMFGAVTSTLFKYILGIRQTDDSAGYKKIFIKPVYLKELGDVSGKIVTDSGEISVEIHYDGDEMKVKYNADDSITVLRDFG